MTKEPLPSENESQEATQRGNKTPISTSFARLMFPIAPIKITPFCQL